MSLESNPLGALSAHELQELIENQVVEKRTLEYKRDLPGPTHTERKEFLRDVSSFANTAGGHIVFGVREDQGRPAELLGLTLTNPGNEIARLENVLRDGLRPRITGTEFASITLPSGSQVLVARVPSVGQSRTWSASRKMASSMLVTQTGSIRWTLTNFVLRLIQPP